MGYGILPGGADVIEFGSNLTDGPGLVTAGHFGEPVAQEAGVISGMGLAGLLLFYWRLG